MTLSLVRHTLRSRRRATMWFAVGMFLYTLLVMGLWPSSSEIDFAAYLEDMPDALKAAFLGGSFDEATVAQSSFYQYVGSQLTAWMPLVLAYFGVWVGAGIIAREYDRHTLDVLLAQPIGRVHYALARVAGVAIAALPVVVLSAAGLLIGVASWGEAGTIRTGDTVLVHVQLLLLTYATVGIGVMFAGILLEPGRTYGVSALVIVGMFVLSVVARVVEPLAWLGNASLFHHWQPLDQFVTGQFDWTAAVIMAGIAVGTTAIGVAVFRWRDLAT